MNRTRVEALQATAMFGAIGDDAVSFLLDRAREVDVGEDEYFFRQDDPGRSAFLLERGSVAILKVWGGREHVLRTLGAGACFGEVALLDFGARSASVRAESPCHALEITVGDLRQLAQHAPEQFALIYMNLGRELSRRLRDADERLFRTLFDDSNEAVADGYSFACI